MEEGKNPDEKQPIVTGLKPKLVNGELHGIITRDNGDVAYFVYNWDLASYKSMEISDKFKYDLGSPINRSVFHGVKTRTGHDNNPSKILYEAYSGG